ncbi:MAG: type II secretion system F family protein, partial [Opitutaceae bacterium]|nr:type II secretion system F family protein [Opitutaceae bacterium]
MPRFAYTAIDLVTGRERIGFLEGANEVAVGTVLKARGLAPTEVKQVARATIVVPPKPVPVDQVPRKRKPITFGRILSQRELAVFTRQLAMLVKSGMPLMRSLEVLARQEKNQAFRDALEQMIETIRSGGTFSEGLQQQPKLFDRLYVNMTKAGESGGVLAVVLERMARFLEKSVQVRGRIKAALTYPLIIVLVAVGIVAALMVVVVPKFEAIFAGLLKGQSLPALTLLLLGASNFIKHHAVLAMGLVAAGYFVVRLLAGTVPGVRLMDRAKLRLPVVGDLLRKAIIARFTRTLGTLLASGVPILQALTITRETSGNVHIADAIGLVHERVKAGDNVAGPLRASGVFPDMVASMIEVGEETGALPDMLTRIADSYDEEVDNAVVALTSLIEPLMIVVMAVMVGT